MTVFRKWVLSAMATSCLFSTGQVSAQSAADWPNKPVRFICPFPPGGSVDPLARLTSARLSPSLT